MAKKPFEILSASFKRKQEQNPRYSLRSLARDLGVAPSYIMAIFSGKKPLPSRRIESLARRLDMDEVTINALRHAMAEEKLMQNELGSVKSQVIQKSKGEAFLERFSEMGMSGFSLLDNWFNVAILDLIECQNFRPDVAWIAMRLNISVREASRAIHDLIENGYLVEDSGRLKKAHELLRLPTARSHKQVRAFHQQMLRKAAAQLTSETSDAAFQRRMISGLTFSANPSKLAQAKQRLSEVLHEISDLLSDDESTEVYQLNCQLFPLTATEQDPVVPVLPSAHAKAK